MSLKSGVILGAILIVILGVLLVVIPAPQEEQSSFISYEVREDSYEIIVQYPRLPYDVVQENLEQIINTYVEGFEEAITEPGAAPVGRPYLLIVEDEEVAESRDTIGITLLVYQDFGGAHGLPQFIGFNFNKETGEEVLLPEVLSYLGMSLEEVSEEVTRHFEKELEESFFSEGAQASEENFSSFLIREDGVTFYFQPYQVAAYALGIQEYTFSLE